MIEERHSDGTPLNASSGLSAALARAQGQFHSIRRDRTVTVRMKTGGTYTFSYAPLEAIFRATMHALSANGIAVTQTVLQIYGAQWMQTTLMHGNETRDSVVPIICSEGGPQAYGSALTYARRYGVTLALAVSADDDDDGNAAEGNIATVIQNKDIHNPRDGLDAVPTDKAIALSDKMREALATQNADYVYALHLEANQDHSLYTAAADLLTAAERAEWKKARKAGAPIA